MFKILDGRENFFQWDINRQLIVEDRTVSQVHFCNKTDDCSLVCEPYEQDGLWVVDVPNILLQDIWRINVYAFDGSYTKHSACFNITARTKPSDYAYTETDVIRLPINEGEAEGSIQTKNAKAIGLNTTAFGASVAGCKGYYYSDIYHYYHGTTKAPLSCVHLSDVQVQPKLRQMANDTTTRRETPTPIGWEVGDKVSIVNGSHYDEILTIRAINGNCIMFEGHFPFEDIQQGDTGADAYTICVPSRPEAGAIYLGEGAFAAGTDVKATGRFSASLGRENRSFGDYSFTAGRNCEAAYASTALGYNCKALGQGSFTAGWASKSTGNNSVTLGGGLINPYDNAFIGGWCNDDTIPDLLMGIGYGFNGVKKNAFSIDIYGNVWVDKSPTKPMGVATKQYVDTAKSTLNTAISKKQDLIKRGVITVSKPESLYIDANTYYVINSSVGDVAAININLNKPTRTDIVNEYKFRIDCTTRLALYYTGEGDLAQIKGLPTTYEQGKTYEISIIDGFAKYTVWE